MYNSYAELRAFLIWIHALHHFLVRECIKAAVKYTHSLFHATAW